MGRRLELHRAYAPEAAYRGHRQGGDASRFCRVCELPQPQVVCRTVRAHAVLFRRAPFRSAQPRGHGEYRAGRRGQRGRLKCGRPHRDARRPKRPAARDAVPIERVGERQIRGRQISSRMAFAPVFRPVRDQTFPRGQSAAVQLHVGACGPRRFCARVRAQVRGHCPEQRRAHHSPRPVDNPDAQRVQGRHRVPLPRAAGLREGFSRHEA
mmetsp:Transcript_103782/g.292739  ORF Transcript_103782/g.292739 Transcript_103782/m.292739 type:complete len:210 (+) Transcript_103782:1232-1861(+)